MQKVIDNIPINIKRKKIKNINMTVKNGEVYISLPQNCSEKKAIDFVLTKKEWIIKHIEKKSIYSLPCEFIDGEHIYIFGEKIPIKIEQGLKPTLIYKNKTLYIKQPKNTPYEGILKLTDKLYKKLLEQQLLIRLPLWENKMKLYSFSHIIRKMKTKWGSCNIKTARLTFNSLLAMYPLKCLDYLIIHELSHIKYPAHNKEFYNLCAKYCPDYKEIKKLLQN